MKDKKLQVLVLAGKARRTYLSVTLVLLPYCPIPLRPLLRTPVLFVSSSKSFTQRLLFFLLELLLRSSFLRDLV